MEKNSEDKIVETFTQTLRIVNSNTIPRISFISKYNEWSKQFETGFKTLAKTKKNLKLLISPNRYLRFSVASLVTLCFLESIRCKSTACCLTGLAILTFLISWNLLTAVIADISKQDESIDSIIFYVESLLNLCKIMTYRLNRTRQIFKIIAGPNFLHTIPGCYKSPVRFKFYNLLYSWLHFCLSWFDVFGILIAVQISIVLYVLEFPDFPKVLQCLSGMGILLVAFLQHIKGKRSREKMQQNRLFLNSITSDYFQWFETRCRLRTFMMKSGYLDLDVQECFHRRFSISKNNAVQSHLMSAVIAVGVAYGLQYEIREEFLDDAVRYLLFNKRPKQNLKTKQKIEVKEQSVRHTSIKKELNSYRDLFGKFTNFITSQRLTSKLPAVVPKEDYLTEHGNVTSNECGIRSDAVSNSSEFDGKKLTIESEEETENFTLCPLPSPDSLEQKKQEDLEPVKVVEFKDVGQLEEKALEINQNNYNQETSSNANILQMATVSSVQEQPDKVLQENDSVALSDSLPCLFSNAKSSLNQPDIAADNLNFDVADEDRVCCHFEWNRLKTTEKVINKFELNDMVKNSDWCSFWNQWKTSEGYKNHAESFQDIPLLNDTVGNHKCCQFIWNHRQALESYLNHTDNTEVDAKLNNAEDNHYVTKTYDNPTSSTLFDECRIAKNSGKDTPTNPNCEAEDIGIIQDSANEKVFKDTASYHQIGPVSFNQYGEYNSINDNHIITRLEGESVCNSNINMRHAENSLLEPDSRGSSHPVPSSERKDKRENEKKLTLISNSLLENRSKNNQHSLQLTNKIEGNNYSFPNSKERCKRTRNAKKRCLKNYPSSSEDESPNKVSTKISDCLDVKRIRKLSLCKFTKRKIKQEDTTKPRSRISQLHQQKLLEMRHGYDIQEKKEENSHYLFLSDKTDLNNFELDSTSVISSTPANGPQSTFASDGATNNQFKFESPPANNNQSMSLPAFVSDNQSVFIPTQNNDNQPMKVYTLSSDDHSVIEASPDTNNLPTKSHLMIFKARNSVPLNHSQLKENIQAYFKNNINVSTQTKDSNLTVTYYEECELPCASNPFRYSDSEALTTDKKDRQQPNMLLKNFETSVEDYISKTELSGSSSYRLNETEGKISFQLVTVTNNQRPIHFDNKYSSFDQDTSNTQQNVFTESSDLEDTKTDSKLDLCETDKQNELPADTNLSQSDIIITKEASASIDTVGLSEDNISLTSSKCPDATDKNYLSLKKRRTSMSEREGTEDPSNGMEQSLQTVIQSKSSTKPKKSNMQWKSDINVDGNPVSDLEEGALHEDFTNPEQDQSPPANLTEPLTYSLKCGNMNLQFTENSPHVTLRFICESNEDITEQKVTKRQISESEPIGDDEFVIPKHEQVHVLEGSSANNEMSFTINSANGDLISKSTHLKSLDGVSSAMNETRSSSSSFQSEPSSSESSSIESDSCSESERCSPTPGADQTTDGHIEEIPMALNEAADGDTNQDLHFETENVKLEFVPTSNSGTLQISYRQSFGHNRLIFKSNDKKLKLKTKKMSGKNNF